MSVRPSMDRPLQTTTDPPANRSCWTMWSHSPQLLQTLSRLSRVLRVNLLSSVKRTGCQWQICQFWCSVVNANRAPRCRAVSTGPTSRLESGPQATLMKCVSDCVVREIHTSGLLEVILYDSGSAHLVPPYTKQQIRSCWWVKGLLTALSSSPWVTAWLLVSPLCSWDCAGRYSKPGGVGLPVPPL